MIFWTPKSYGNLSPVEYSTENIQHIQKITRLFLKDILQ